MKKIGAGVDYQHQLVCTLKVLSSPFSAVSPTLPRSWPAKRWVPAAFHRLEKRIDCNRDCISLLGIRGQKSALTDSPFYFINYLLDFAPTGLEAVAETGQQHEKKIDVFSMLLGHELQ